MQFKSKKNFSPTYCPLAWAHSFINQDGSYQVCCTSEEFDNYIRDDKGEKLYIDQDITSKEVMNTTFMKNLRLQMLKGEWPELCTRCKIVEDMGGVSRRNVEIKNYQKSNQKFIKVTKKDGSANVPIQSADYRLGNLCNLQCRMCNPRSSKLWIGEWNEMKPEEEKFSQEIMDSYKNYNWIDSEKLVEDFKAKAASLTHIHFAGGEPLIVPQMSKILRICIESGNAKNITITYNTNLTVLPERVLELWKEFKGIKLLASIDAIGNLNNYIRYPSNWEKIDKNLQYIEKNHKEFNIEECMLSATIQILNVLRLEELYEYLSQFSFIVPVPNLVNLHVPRHFQTTSLPNKLKILAGIKLGNLKEKYESKIPPHYKYLTDNIPQIIKFMHSYNGQKDGQFDNFLEFQKKFDKKREIDLFSVCPELKSYTTQPENN